jgi:hypothetical protein
MFSVFICSAVVTKCYKMGGLNNRFTFLTVLGSRSPRIRELEWSDPGEGLFLVCKSCLPLYTQRRETGEKGEREGWIKRGAERGRDGKRETEREEEKDREMDKERCREKERGGEGYRERGRERQRDG